MSEKLKAKLKTTLELVGSLALLGAAILLFEYMFLTALAERIGQ